MYPILVLTLAFLLFPPSARASSKGPVESLEDYLKGLQLRRVETGKPCTKVLSERLARMTRWEVQEVVCGKTRCEIRVRFLSPRLREGELKGLMKASFEEALRTSVPGRLEREACKALARRLKEAELHPASYEEICRTYGLGKGKEGWKVEGWKSVPCKGRHNDQKTKQSGGVP